MSDAYGYVDGANCRQGRATGITPAWSRSVYWLLPPAKHSPSA